MKICLYYWRGLNCGDALSPFIIENLWRKKVSYFNVYCSLLHAIKKGLFKQIIIYVLGGWYKNILAIGSILSSANRRSIVWGSGFMTANEKCKARKIYAVRGKLTAVRLKELGYNIADIVYGDPALLLPLLVSPSKQKKYFVGIIPHWCETDKFISQYGNQFHIIDMRTDNIKEFVKDLTSCKYIFSSSLHGIIIAHAYGIPALLIEKKEEKEYGYFKYEDYFSSVAIEPYHWIDINENLLANNYNVQLLFSKYADKALPQTNLRTIQRDLLRTAPFPLKNKYKNLFY